MTELRFSLQAKQKLFLQSVENTPTTLYGGAKGGGKSKGMRDILLLRRFRYPKTHAGLFRRTYKELEGNHIRPIFKEFPALEDYWNDSKKILKLPNGSTLEFCHAENEKDIGLYQGREFEDLGIEEAGEWTEAEIRKLQGSNRSATPGFKARTLLTANPGGKGHSFLKRLFIERRFKPEERPQDYAFVPALVDDNPALMQNDPDYVHKLNTLPNLALRKAYRYGDWDIFAGQYFSEIRREIHLIQPFDIPNHWNRFGSYDFGFNHPAAFGWFAADGDGNIYLYRELIQAGLRVDQFAQKLKLFKDTESLSSVIGGLDCWAKRSNVVKSVSIPTIAEEFAENGIQLTRAKVDRVQGATQLRNYLAWQDLPGGRSEPRFKVFDTCPITYDCLARMEHDPNHVEDVLKVDAIEGDVQTGDDCFARGTMISTSRGQQAIESLNPGDMVWTRAGLKPVIDQWLNGFNSKTLKLTLSNGREIIATPKHKFWTKKGFVRVDMIRYGERLLCLNQSSLYSTESNSGAILNLSEGTCETISGLLQITEDEALARFMWRFGKLRTERFPRGLRFITPMGIHSTTNWKTWCHSLLPIILESISKTPNDLRLLARISKEYAHWLVPGISRQLVANGTVRIARAPGLNAKGSNHVAWSVPRFFIRSVLRSLSSAITTANPRNSENSILDTKNGLNSLFVDSIEESTKIDTYSLHIADQHEYFAGGILVSNSYDMVRYGLMSRPLLAEPLKRVAPPHGTKEWANDQAIRMEDKLEQQITAQKQQDGEEDFWATAQMDDDQDVLRHFLNKRKS